MLQRLLCPCRLPGIRQAKGDDRDANVWNAQSMVENFNRRGLLILIGLYFCGDLFMMPWGSGVN